MLFVELSQSTTSYDKPSQAAGIELRQLELPLLGAFQAEIAATGPEQRDISRLALSLSEEQDAELRERLNALLREAAAWDPVEDGKRVAVFLAIYARD